MDSAKVRLGLFNACRWNREPTRSPPGEVVRMVSSGEPALCFAARILSEYNDVLKRPETPGAEVIHPQGQGPISDTGP